MATKRCGNCAKRREVIYLGVRFYEKRSQVHYQLQVCGECSEVLQTMVAAAATGMMKSMFDHGIGVPAEEAIDGEGVRPARSH